MWSCFISNTNTMAKRNEPLEEIEGSEEIPFTPVETEVVEYPNGLRLKMKKKTAPEERYELPCGVEVVKRRGTGEDMMRIVRQSGGKPDRIATLLIHNLIEFIDEDGKRQKMQVEDIQTLDIEDYLALQEIVNPEKKAHRIQDSI